ncbi:MAG: hypothetical protein KF686_01975 [Ramlibacter sp.]|nr:hypothetical protein [Ramlibacter sp.]
MIRPSLLSLLLVLGASLQATVPMALAAGRDLSPTSDSQVVESLGPRIRPLAATPEAAAAAARQAITQARELADPRYLGRAQAALAPWWNQADAPAALAVLQATVQQSRHEFAAARVTLERALQRDPLQAQGWLTLATLDRLSGRYADALVACGQVARAGAPLYAAACQLETRSLRGEYDEASRGLEALRRQAPDAATQAWLLSLLAENEERAGRDAAALASYRASLALARDGYTALAAADLLLRTGQAAEALRVLAAEPASDAVMLRRAHALKLMGDAGWKAMASELRERFLALDARGDDPATHARERALGALWLEADPRRALMAAQINLGLQKEPLDWWLALQSADQAGHAAELAALRAALAQTGLRDARLSRWQNGGKP